MSHLVKMRIYVPVAFYRDRLDMFSFSCFVGNIQINMMGFITSVHCFPGIFF